jgi:hypothetical protein
MGISLIREYADDICRDFSVLGNSVFVGCGQGCETVYYLCVPSCRALLRHLGRVPSGRDAGLCGVCAGSHSVTENGFTRYPEHVCKEYKNGLSMLASEILRKNPSSGKIDPDIWPLKAAAKIVRNYMKAKKTVWRKNRIVKEVVV